MPTSTLTTITARISIAVFSMIDPAFPLLQFFSCIGIISYGDITASCFCLCHGDVAARSGENCRAMTGFLRRRFIRSRFVGRGFSHVLEL